MGWEIQYRLPSADENARLQIIARFLILKERFCFHIVVVNNSTEKL